jgi:hypothetical protein
MGLYVDTCIFYGCPVTTHPEKINVKLSGISARSRRARNIRKIGQHVNYFITNEAGFVVVPRTCRLVDYELQRDDILHGRVKLSTLTEHALTKDDVIPTANEHAEIYRYIDALVKDEHKAEAYGKLDYYAIQTFFSTLDGDFRKSMCHLLKLDMEK